ncbi:MAG TPA: hypothetical protein VMI31_04015 [Fimbriimonadaceae bacterium]|nr:hypothetical protein [Fimbriimonadaceae bacterium]
MAREGRASKTWALSPARASRKVVFAAVAVAFAALAGIHGCGPGAPPATSIWVAKDSDFTPEAGSSNAFDSYVLIAKNVETNVPTPLLRRVYFDPDHEKTVLGLLDQPLAQLVEATKKKCDFHYVPPPMFAAPPYQQGWRLLGRGLQWRIQKACAAGDYDTAIADDVAATKFGFDLTGGSALDASLGLNIADDARKAIAPFLAKMGAQQLEVLAAGLTDALDGKPPLTTTIDHEHERMLQGIQYIQDAYFQNRFDDLMKNMREDVRDGVTYLRDLKSRDASARPAYFAGFVAEADEEARWLTSIASMPEVARRNDPPPPLAKQRPWKSFAMELFTAAAPLLEIDDATIARTRLSILTCEILKSIKTSQIAPKDLSGFPKEITTDPYTGRSFAYRAASSIFDVYSLGADGIDNAGDTDETCSTPDLRLEDRT